MSILNKVSRHVHRNLRIEAAACESIPKVILLRIYEGGLYSKNKQNLGEEWIVIAAILQYFLNYNNNYKLYKRFKLYFL